MQSFVLIFQIFIAISLGYFIAPHISPSLKKFVFKILPYFSYVLLIAVAFELTQALNHIQHPTIILPPALLIAFTTSIGSFSICLLTFKLVDRKSTQGKISFHLFINALKNIAKAFLALGIGILLGTIVNLSNVDIAFNSWYLLLVFIFLIGIELAFTSFDRSWLSWKILLVPVAAFMGSCLASVLNYFLLSDHYKLNEVMALAQGYGWYSMSGILFTELHSAKLGGYCPAHRFISRNLCYFTDVLPRLAFSTLCNFECRSNFNGCYSGNGEAIMWHTLCATCHDEWLNSFATRTTID